MATKQVMLESVEKLIQIGQMSGDINVQGNVERVVFSVGEDLRSALQSSSKPEEGITDLIVKTADKFSDDELMDFDTGVEITFLLTVHPNPIIALDILSSRRPKADMITLYVLLPLFKNFEKHANLLRMLDYDPDKKFQELTNALESTRAIKELLSEGVLVEVVLKLVQEYLQSYTQGKFTEWAYFANHPEVLLLSVDWFIVAMARDAFLKSDHKALEHFMDIRQTLSNYRSGG